jgi:hypothetical protein
MNAYRPGVVKLAVAALAAPAAAPEYTAPINTPARIAARRTRGPSDGSAARALR